MNAAFKSDFRRVESEYDKQQEKTSQMKGLALEKISNERAEQEQEKKLVAQRQKELVKEKLAALDKGELEILEQEFVASIQLASALMKAYKKGGVDQSLVQGRWFSYLD